MNSEGRDEMFEDLVSYVHPSWEVEKFPDDVTPWTKLAMVYPQQLTVVSRIERLMRKLRDAGYIPVLEGTERVGIKVLMKRESCRRVLDDD